MSQTLLPKSRLRGWASRDEGGNASVLRVQARVSNGALHGVDVGCLPCRFVVAKRSSPARHSFEVQERTRKPSRPGRPSRSSSHPIPSPMHTWDCWKRSRSTIPRAIRFYNKALALQSVDAGTAIKRPALALQERRLPAGYRGRSGPSLKPNPMTND
jgi:hypothetical protein